MDDGYFGLIEKLRQSGKNYDLDRIDRAYQMALLAHGTQTRVSGEPYITHPVAVAGILADLGMDTDTLVAALLHDVVEDTACTLEQVEKLYGQEVALLVDGVTKLGKVPFVSREEQQAENVRKMLLAMAQDVRVVIIKLADRLHNMRTIGVMREDKQLEKALETMEVYAPLAHRLGIRALKEELEDKALHILDPVACAEIEDQLALRKEQREDFLKRIKQRLYERLRQEHEHIEIEARVKSVYGIYRKVYMQGRAFEEIYDIYACRVLVDSVFECYNILGIIHDMFRPIPNRFKDYISTPKANRYQSLHTTVFDKEGIPFEVQIRTFEMHNTAEYGVAAHWKYKVGLVGKDSQDSLDERLSWVRQLLESQKESDDVQDLVKSIKTDLAPEEVFVFTPRGDVISLPTDSTVIDFAYAIHSAVGNKMVGAKVDGRIVSLDYKVKTGHIVEVLTSNAKGNGPSRDWLNIVRTSEARNKIRAWFKKEKRDENIQEGRGMVEREFRRNQIALDDKSLDEFITHIADRQHFNTAEEFYAALGYGGISLQRLLPRIKEDFLKNYRKQPEPEKPVIKPKKEKTSSGVVVEGLDSCLVKFARCCNPLPGDSIIGFVTRGYGVSIHKQDCVNVAAGLADSDPEQKARWVRAEWADRSKETFKSTLDVYAVDRQSLIADVSMAVSNMHLAIHSLNAKELKDNHVGVQMTISVSDLDQLNFLMGNLRKIPGVVNIQRTGL